MTIQSGPTSTEPRNDRAGSYYGYVIVVISFFIIMATLAVHFSYGLFFKPILNELGWSRTTVSGAYSLVWIVQGIMGIVAGLFNDRYGPRLVVTLSGIFLGTGYILMSQVSQVWQVYLFYGIFVGIGLSSAVPVLSNIVHWFTRRRGLMVGIVVTGASIGALIGPPIANWLICGYDWRISYIVMGACCLVILVVAAQFLKRPSHTALTAESEKTAGKNEGKSGTADFPLSRAIRTHQFWFIYILFFCFGFCVFALQVHVVPHVTDIGISSTKAANILAVAGATGIIGRIGLGSLGDRIGNKKSFIIVFTLFLAALILLLPAGEIWEFYLVAILFGLTFGNGVANQSPLVATFFGLKSHGVLLGFLAMGYTFGAAAGPTVLGYMYDMAGNYQFAFIVTIIVAVLGLIATLLLKHFKSL